MNLLTNPSPEKLEGLQQSLDEENRLRHVGIIDIWVTLDPVYLALEHEGKIVAAASLSVGNGAELYKLYVSPSHRKQGLADSLLKASIAMLKKQGFTELLLEFTNESIPFWQNTLPKFRSEQVVDNKFFIYI